MLKMQWLHGESFIWTMWDVKKDTRVTISNYDTSFIWTMWDVKGLGTIKKLEDLVEFYMNYVGCKAWIVEPDSVGQYTFYMNYVGCKGRNRIICCICGQCFIWTMWDVKATCNFSSGLLVPVLYELCGM